MKKKASFKLGLIIISLIIILSALVSAGEIKSDLSNILNKSSATDKIPVIIIYNEMPNSEDVGALQSEGAAIKHQYSLIKAVSAQISAQSAKRIAQRASVKLIEPDYKVKLVLDTSTSQISADDVWNKNITGKNINVAVIDTGIHDEHPALEIVKEIDYTGEGTDDLNGHGTHVAGIIASTDSKYMGVAPSSNLFNVKVLNQYGSGYGSDVIMGLEWATNNGASVISMSLGAEIVPCDGTDAISLAVDEAVKKGIVVVVAAGNSGPEYGTINSPGCSKNGVTVGAVDDNDNIAYFSSRGPTSDGRIKPDLVAPGVGITSTWKDNSFVSLSGTSMATPHVSGIVALLLEVNPSLEPEDVKTILKSTAFNLGLDENTQGAGRVNAYNAYIYLINITAPTNETGENKTEEINKTIPGIEEPKNKLGSIGYKWLRARESLRLMFTFNQEEKAKLYLTYAERRLSEALNVLEENEDQGKELLKEYEQNLKKAKISSEIAVKNGGNATQIMERIEHATRINQEVLNASLGRVQEKARETIQNVINSPQNEEASKLLENKSQDISEGSESTGGSSSSDAGSSSDSGSGVSPSSGSNSPESIGGNPSSESTSNTSPGQQNSQSSSDSQVSGGNSPSSSGSESNPTAGSSSVASGSGNQESSQLNNGGHGITGRIIQFLENIF